VCGQFDYGDRLPNRLLLAADDHPDVYQQVSIADYAESGETPAVSPVNIAGHDLNRYEAGDYVVENRRITIKSAANIANFVSHLKQIADSAGPITQRRYT